jgi:hypothetical protein
MILEVAYCYNRHVKRLEKMQNSLLAVIYCQYGIKKARMFL